MATDETDVVVIGSGFGGSVAALRLAEKGYAVTVFEAGRRFTAETLPRTSWDLRRFLWAPRLGLRGIQRIHRLDDVILLAGAGVGGGSLVYANTLYRPPVEFYRDPQWAGITDWQAELAPWFDQAERMLGVVPNPTLTAADEAMLTVARQLGREETFRPTPVGVFFGPPGELRPDPYFGGAGPSRSGCRQCGECMTGCRYGAKNRLDVNYLYLAERAGVRICPDTTVTRVRPLSDGRYAVAVRPTGARRRELREVVADDVVFAAGAYGSQRLLHELRDTGVLPRLSPRLGELTRTNSESLLGARSLRRDADFTRGVAITSSWYPDPQTHVEPVRYGRGSNAMGLLGTLLVPGEGPGPTWWRLLWEMVRQPGAAARTLNVRHWSERTIIVLVMQALDNSLTVFRRPGRVGGWRLGSRPGHGQPNPTWLPIGHQVARLLAAAVHGEPGGTWGEVFRLPMTAHFIGGCVIGDSGETGVVDPYHRVFGHPGLHVVDGSTLSANPGVNPSLSITAQAERAFAMWPNRGDPDPRPPLGTAYRPVPSVPPRQPAVPAAAPGAWRDRPLPADRRQR